jgi:purine nucleosidase
MAGAFQARGNQSHTAEYNVAIDPESARVVFDRFENIVVLPWEVSVDQGMSWERLNRLIALNTPRARFLKAMTPHMQKWRDTFFMPTLPMPDPLTVMIALDPNVATKHIDCRVRVDTARDVGRAMTALDVRTPHKNARMVTQIDEVKAWGMLDAAWSI